MATFFNSGLGVVFTPQVNFREIASALKRRNERLLFQVVLLFLVFVAKKQSSSFEHSDGSFEQLLANAGFAALKVINEKATNVSLSFLAISNLRLHFCLYTFDINIVLCLE